MTLANRMARTLACLAVAGILAAPAVAGDKPKKKDRETVFKKLDANGDGKVTLAEMKGKGKKDATKVEAKFKKLDKDKDGSLTLAEMTPKKKKA